MAQSTTSRIRYSLLENHLNPEQGPKFLARVKRLETIDQSKLIELMADHNTTVSRQDIIVVMDLLEEIITKELLRGNRIRTNLLNAGVSIRGGFENEEENVDKAKHEVAVRMQAAVGLKKSIKFASSFEKVDHSARKPVIKSFFDFHSETLNSSLSPGFSGLIKGKYFSLNQADPDQGVFLTRVTDNTVFRVEQVLSKTGKAVLFTIPADLTAGVYKLSVACVYAKSCQRSEHDSLLTVT